MNAYLFTASVTRFRTGEPSPAHGAAANQRQIWTSGVYSIVCAENTEEARKRFEEWSCAMPEGDSGIESRIDKLTAAQFVDELLTETESVPTDWQKIAQQAQTDLESTAADEAEQGYWLDVNGVIPSSATLEDLRRELPEDISSGLNWAAEKQFFFLFSVLSPPPPPASEEWEEPEGGNKEDAPGSEEGAEEPDSGLAEALAEFPQLADKEAAALVRARNSAVAAWLWQKYAAETRLAGNQVRIDPWCGVMGVEAKSDPDAVIAECTKAIELKPGNGTAYRYRGVAKHDKGDLDGAIADYTKAIELQPDDAIAYSNRSVSRKDKGELDEAVVDCNKAIELQPENMAAYYNRGNAKQSKGDLDGAIADYTKVFALKPDAGEAYDTYNNRSIVRKQKGDYEGAISDCNKAIELRPDNAFAYGNRGNAEFSKGDLEAAIADYTKVIELTPNDAKAYSARGNVSRTKGDLEGALADYAKALELNPKYAWAYHTRGCLRYDTQEFKDALVDFRKVLELDSYPKDYARFRIWMIRARSGEAEAANTELQTYLDSRTTGKPDDWEAIIGRFLCGQIAEPEFLAAAKNADSRTEAGQLCQAYFYAGSKRLFAGDKTTATDYFQKSIATDQRACTEYSSAAAELENLKSHRGKR